MTIRRPLTIRADGCAEELPQGDTLPLPFFDFVKTEDGLVNQTTTLEDYLILSTSVPDDGTYEISWYYEWSYNDGGQDMIVEIDLNGTVIGQQRQEPKDVGGTGVTLPNTSGGTVNTGTNQRHEASGFDIQQLLSGPQSIRMRFAGSSTNDEAALRRARICIRRVA